MIQNLKTKTNSFLYTFLHPWVYASARVFYRTMRIEGLDKFPPNGTPTILISNHQNGLMDPLLCCLISPRQLHFLTRADVFRKPVARKIVTSLNMMPVFRAHDRVADMSGMNQKIFEICVGRLRKGAVIGMFPEGNHGNKKILRPFKKGMARLAYLAHETYPDMQDFQVVPVGLDYSDYEGFRSDVTIRVGDPIPLQNWLNTHPNNPKNQGALMQLVREGLLKTLYDLRPSSHYTLLSEALLLLQRTTHTSFEEQKVKMAQFGTYLDAPDNNGPQLEHTLEKLKDDLNSVKLEPIDLFEDKGTSSILMLKLLFLLPFLLFSLVLHGIPFASTAILVKKMVKDPHFVSTFKLILGMVIFTFYHVVVFTFIGSELGWRWGLAYLLSALLCGNFALIFRRNFRNFKKIMRVTRWKNQESELWIEAQAWQKELLLRMSPNTFK